MQSWDPGEICFTTKPRTWSEHSTALFFSSGNKSVTLHCLSIPELIKGNKILDNGHLSLKKWFHTTFSKEEFCYSYMGNCWFMTRTGYLFVFHFHPRVIQSVVFHHFMFLVLFRELYKSLLNECFTRDVITSLPEITKQIIPYNLLVDSGGFRFQFSKQCTVNVTFPRSLVYMFKIFF